MGGAATQPSRGIPTATAVDHVGFNVADLDAAVAFFTDVFGFELLERSAPRPATPGPAGSATVRLAMLRYGDALVELLEFRQPGRSWAIPAMRDPGGYHLALTVTDLDTAIAYLRAKPGVAVAEPDQLPGGRRRAFFTTPKGLPMQLITPDTGRIL